MNESTRIKSREAECPYRSGKTCIHIDGQLGFTAGVPWTVCDGCWEELPLERSKVRDRFVQVTVSTIKQNIGKVPYSPTILKAIAEKHATPEESLRYTEIPKKIKEWDRVSHTWDKAHSFLMSTMSKGLTGRRVELTIHNQRHISCFGTDLQGTKVQDPCPALAKSSNGRHYCNQCGCGDREIAHLDRDGYPKLAYPYLECPLQRPGFSNSLQSPWLPERAVIINLNRRKDRMESLMGNIGAIRWPGPKPERFRAVDATTAPPPPGWRWGTGAWGCLQSHIQVLQRALEDGTQTLMVIEDDAEFPPEFPERLTEFLRVVPSDWDMLFLGGQHVRPPVDAGPVFRATYPNRTHCYIINRKFMVTLYHHWSTWHRTQNGHCDHMIAELAGTHKFYTPREFMVAQRESLSDINGRVNSRRTWTEPAPDAPLWLAHGPTKPTDPRFHMGNTRTPGGWDVGLEGVHTLPSSGRRSKLLRLARVLQMEARDMGREALLWHPHLFVHHRELLELFPHARIYGDTP